MISVIMPMFNESSTIRHSIETMYKALRVLKDDWELILIDDGSTDNSRELALQMMRDYPRFHVFGYEKNKGRGRALREGFAHARGDIIVTTEADSSWGTELVISLITGLQNDPDCDVLIASPNLPGGGYKNVPLVRVLISRIGNAILKAAFSQELTMTTGMMRGYKAAAIKSLDLESDGKEIHIEILSKVLALGLVVKEIPGVIDWSLQQSKKVKRRSTLKIRRTVLSHLLFSFIEAPILLLGATGLGSIALGILFGLILIYTRFTSQEDLSRPLINLTILLIITGTQLLIFCFLAYQNKRTQNQIVRLQRDIRFSKK
ncbi:MAG TPA: glycosyltransferase family 2 protein [Candidatus Omnitrophota bacterium]|nr:glycosyltransferase family 2 protein [Candidatus Omnitrophota bacterium]HPT07755.1 glycosyltransferase family 2 protein [Candidatus Omnitrophota bacterium]